MKLSKGLIRADIIAACQAIDYYDEKKIRDIKNVAAYHLQQATEKLIKYQIYEKCSDVDYSQMYTHNIDRLIAYSEAKSLSLIVPSYIRENCVSISTWEAGSRYDIGFSIRIDMLKKAYEIISKWERQVR